MKKTIDTETMERLHAWLDDQKTIYTVLRHVAASGMGRDISLFIFKDGQPIILDYSVSTLLDLKLKNGGIHVDGAGMDMGFYLIYRLCRSLYDDGYKINQQWL